MKPIRPILGGVVAAGAAALLVFATGGADATITTALPAGGLSITTDGPLASADTDATSALVQLAGDPLTVAAKTHPPQGKKIDFDNTTVKSERARLSALRNDFKQWLRANAPKAKVTGEYDISLNAVAVQLNGESLATIASSPLVVRAEPQYVYHPLDDNDPDLNLISAIDAWEQAGGEASAGAGVKVAIVDTGIDQTHPCFDDTGYATADQLGDTRFTNNKVIAARVFNNKTPQQNYTPEAIQEHGTHVAGTVACNFDTPATVEGVTIPYAMSGVAPAALLGNYNVFPGLDGNARSEDILNALEAAYADGFDVANMSLGGGAHGIQDLLTMAVDNLDQGNMVVAVANGNSGPGHFTVESPGSAARALSAGASTVPHFIGPSATVGGDSYGLAAGDFGVLDEDTTLPLGVVPGAVNGLSTACNGMPLPDLTGKIALISRGTCTFSEKIRNAQNAGAELVLVANNVGGDPIAMGQDGTPNQPTVAAFQIGLTDAVGPGSLSTHDGEDVTVTASLVYNATDHADIMAAFSSQGPTDVDFRIKPDVVAPGVNVLSSIPHQFCDTGDTTGCFAFFQGTSMATPHLAGSAAVVKSQHPSWTAAQIRSAIVNTADTGVLKASTGLSLTSDPNIIGAGRENLLSAVNAVAALDPVSTSFGAVPSGSGQTNQETITITNLSGSSKTYALSVGSPNVAGVSFSLSASSVTLGAGESATITVSAASAKGASLGDHFATLHVSVGGTEVAHAVVYQLVK